MRLSRPVAIGLMVLCALVVLWLVAQTLSSDEDPGTTSPTGAVAPTFAGTGDHEGEGGDDLFDEVSGDDTSEDDTFAEPSGTPYPEDGDDPGASGTPYPGDGGDAGPTGTDTRDWDDVDACRDDVLPPELDEVADDIEAGGPFEYDRDGITFQNREGYLPDEQGGYYREYTVETPGLDHRGARRIVTGGDDVDPDVWYYTDDHYESFCEFAP